MEKKEKKRKKGYWRNGFKGTRQREREERERGRLFTLVRFWCTASLSPSSNWAVAVLIYLPFIKPPWSVRDAPMQSGPLRAREVAATTKKNRLSMPSTPFPHNRYVDTYVCTRTHTQGQHPSWTRMYTIRRWHVGDKKEKRWIKKRERRGGRKIGSIGWKLHAISVLSITTSTIVISVRFEIILDRW